MAKMLHVLKTLLSFNSIQFKIFLLPLLQCDYFLSSYIFVQNYLNFVQVALTSQFLVFNSPQLLAMPVSELDNVVACHQSRSGFLMLLVYDCLLLFLLLVISPLVARSKRNYREGLFFCVAAWLYLVCWSLWVTGFLFLGDEWRAMSIASGQVACASVVLAAVFIPRTYMIVSSVTRARIASAIPCAAAAYSSSTNILDIQYRSNQVKGSFLLKRGVND